MFKVLWVVVISALFLSSSFAEQESRAPKTASEPSSSPVSSSAEEAHFTPEQLKDYYLVYTDADVRYLRKLFDSYLHSQAKVEQQFNLLRKWNSEYYRSKFVVFSRDQNPFGGTLVRIMFQEKPDKIFIAWVYPEGEARRLTLRAFEPDKVMDEDIARIRSRYKELLEDRGHAM